MMRLYTCYVCTVYTSTLYYTLLSSTACLIQIQIHEYKMQSIQIMRFLITSLSCTIIVHGSIITLLFILLNLCQLVCRVRQIHSHAQQLLCACSFSCSACPSYIYLESFIRDRSFCCKGYLYSNFQARQRVIGDQASNLLGRDHLRPFPSVPPPEHSPRHPTDSSISVPPPEYSPSR